MTGFINSYMPPVCINALVGSGVASLRDKCSYTQDPHIYATGRHTMDFPICTLISRIKGKKMNDIIKITFIYFDQQDFLVDLNK